MALDDRSLNLKTTPIAALDDVFQYFTVPYPIPGQARDANATQEKNGK
jgi:hypothetical protein